MRRGSPEARAQALVVKGASELEEGQIDAAIEAFDEVERRFGDHPAPAVRRWVASALGLRAVGLGRSGRLEDAIGGFDAVALRFADDRGDPEVRKQLAAAVFNKGLALAELGKVDEAIAALDATAAEFGDDDRMDVLSEVAGALGNKVQLLAGAGQKGAAIDTVDDIVRRFGTGEAAAPMRGLVAAALADKAALLLSSDPGSARAEVDRAVQLVRDDPRPEVRREGVQALDTLARGLAQLGDLDGAAEVFGEITRVFSDDEDLANDAASAGFNRGVALRDSGRLPEATLAFDDVATRYDGNPDSFLRRMSIGALFNKAIVLSGMTETAATLDALSTVITRFHDDDDPQVIDWVRRARETLDEVRMRGLHSVGRVDEPATAQADHAEAPADSTRPVDLSDVLAQARRLEARGDVEGALELTTSRRRELSDHPHGVSLLELDSERGWLQLSTGDVSIAGLTLVDVHSRAREALAVAEATLAHGAETYGLWYTGRKTDSASAIARLEFALQLRAERREEAADYRDTLFRLGEMIERCGVVAETRARIEARVRELETTASADELLDRPRLLTFLAELNRREGRPDAAKAAAHQALDQVCMVLGADSPVAQAAQELISGPGPIAPESPEAVLRHAASIGLRLLGRNWAEHLDELRTLESEGRINDALDLVGRLPGEPEDEPALRLAEAWLHSSAGESDAAAQAFAHAYSTAFDAWARIEEVVSRSANSLGLLYRDNTGDTAAAIEFLRVALRHRASRDEDRYLLAQTMINLGLAYEVPVGDNTRARRLLDEASDRVAHIPEIANTSEHAQVLIQLAGFRRRQDDADAAETAARAAIGMTVATLPPDNPVTAVGYQELARALRAQGRSAEAQVHTVHATTILERCQPAATKLLAEARVDLVDALIDNGDIQAAVGQLEVASRVVDFDLLHKLEPIPVDERLAVTMGNRHLIDRWLSLARAHSGDTPEAAKGAFNALDRRKAMSDLVSLNLLHADAASPQFDVQRRQLRMLRREASDAMLRPLAEDKDQLSKLQREISSLETLLSLGRQAATTNATVRDADAQRLRERSALWAEPNQYLAATLNPDEALIEFGRYRESEGDRYLGFVQVGGQQQVTAIDIGEADHVDALVRDYLNSMATDGAFLLGGGMLEGGSSVAAARRLRVTVIDPILAVVAGARRLFVVPDGALAAIPLQALNDDAGGYLIDTHEVSYLTSAGVLLQPMPPTPPPGPPIVFADPDFDLGAPAGRTGDPFPRLEWTAVEARHVGELLGVPEVTGAEATEEVLLACKGPRLLHIATHGWFLPAQEQGDEQPRWMSHPRLKHLANLTYLTRLGVSVVGVNAESSAALYGQLFVRCGLVTAGFNTVWAGGTLPESASDGLLTAADVASLDLLGTELVVLSACETGLGQAVDIEAVYGLRRAFEMAGASNIVAALWQVADESTSRFMGEFYRHLREGEEPARSLRVSQLQVRRVLPHPYFWGGFICQGARRRPATLPHDVPGPRPHDVHGAPPALADADQPASSSSSAEAGEARVLHNHAVRLQDRGQLNEAETVYRQAAVFGFSPSANNLGELLWIRGDLEGAEMWLRRALDRGYEPAEATLGHVLGAQGRDDEAEMYWRRAARSDAFAALKLGGLLSSRGDTVEAMIWLRRAAEDGLRPAALLLGQILLAGKDYEESEIWLRQASEDGSSEAAPYLEQVRVQREEEAAAERTAPRDDVQATADLAMRAVQRGDFDEALRLWSTADVEGHEDVTRNLARLLAAEGGSEQAERLLRPLAAREDAEAAHLLAILLYRRGEVDDALPLLRRAIEGGEVEAKTDLALILWKQGDHSEAETLMAEAANAGSDEAARSLAAALEEIGRRDEATHWWRVAAEAGNTYGAYGLGQSLYARGEVREGEHWLRRGAVAGELSAISSLGRVLAARNDPEAEEWLRRSVDAGESGDAILLAQLLSARGERDEADRRWQQAMVEAQTKDTRRR
jgi:tetratricopeptide (TPR) repeat protein